MYHIIVFHAKLSHPDKYRMRVMAKHLKYSIYRVIHA